MVVPATATPLTSACFLPPSPSGFRRPTPSLHFRPRHSHKTKCNEKSIPGPIAPKIGLNPLPYELNALEPHMSRETLELHWGEHQRSYVENLNNQIEETNLQGMTLEQIMLTTYNKGNILPPFHNAAQILNNQFFWESMKPDGGGKPSGDLLELINQDFGSFEAFVKEFKSAATTQFGSGWAWLVYKDNILPVGNAINPCPSEKDKKLFVVKSPNAVNPLVWDYLPLLTIDVWEHAYYLDFQDRRGDYVSNFLDKLVSWETVSMRLEMAKARVAARGRVNKDEEARQEIESQAAADSEIEEELLLDGEIEEELLLDSDVEDFEAE